MPYVSSDGGRRSRVAGRRPSGVDLSDRRRTASYRDAVARDVTSLHHLSWFVDDLDQAITAAEATGATILQSGTRVGRRFTTFGPMGGNGTIVELIEVPDVDPPRPPAVPAGTQPGPFSAAADQLGFAVPDLDKVVHGWLQLGVGPWLTLKNAKVRGYEYRGTRSSPTLDVAFTQLGSLQLEVIRPADDERSSYGDFIAAGAPGLQHLGWFVDDLDAAIAAGEAEGGSILQTGSWSGVRFAYFEPSDGNGTITELIGMTDLSRELFAMIRERAQVSRWDGKTNPSRNALRAADWGLRWHAVRAQLADVVHRG